MKIDVKKILCKSIMALMVIPFFLVNSIPVLADYDVHTFPVTTEEAGAYVYWNNMGYNLVTLQHNNTTVTIPNISASSGATNYSYQCRLSGTTYSCAAYNPAGSYMGTYDWYTIESHTETENNAVLRGVEIPWLQGTYIHDTGYNSSRAFQVGAGDRVIFAFISSKNLWSNGSTLRWFNAYTRDADNNEYKLIGATEMNGYYKYIFSIKNKGSSENMVSLNFPAIDSNTNIIPIYLGNDYMMTDSLKQELNIDTDIELGVKNISSKIESINSILSKMKTNIDTISQTSVSTNNSLISGNATSQTAQSALNNSNTTLNNRVNQMNSIETEYNSDLNAALNDIDLSTDLVQHTGFTNAALWVSAQFNRLVIGTPLELVITFSLITGLALVLIGKVRG